MARRDIPLPRITRDRLQAGQALRNLQWVEEQIRDRLQQLDLAEVPALRVYADIQWRKINKCLPDLKPVDEATGSSETVIRVKVT